MIYAMIQGYAYTIYGGYGGGRDKKSVWEHSREQRKRRPEVYITEAQKGPGGKGPRPKARGGAPGVICPILPLITRTGGRVMPED